MTDAELKKKQKERRWLQDAIRASGVFPAGNVRCHEKPDFLLETSNGILGIEVTEICRDQPRRIGALLDRVPEKARSKFNATGNGRVLDVNASFSVAAKEMTQRDLVNSLFACVHQNRARTSWKTEDWRTLPKGFCYLSLEEPREAKDLIGNWRGFAAFDVTPADEYLVRKCIQEKEERINVYRQSAPINWLLIVNDTFLGPGEVRVAPSLLLNAEFSFSFDKVLLFAREVSGKGDIFELRRKATPVT